MYHCTSSVTLVTGDVTGMWCVRLTARTAILRKPFLPSAMALCVPELLNQNHLPCEAAGKDIPKRNACDKRNEAE
jgi:hypothetical protein